MKSNLTKTFSEYFVKKLSNTGWQLTYGNWEENVEQKTGQEMFFEDELRLIIISYPNVYFSGENPDNHVSLLINDKVKKKYVEFGFDFENVDELERSLDLIIQKQIGLCVDNCGELIQSLLELNKRMTWESQSQILEEINSENVFTNKYIVYQ